VVESGAMRTIDPPDLTEPGNYLLRKSSRSPWSAVCVTRVLGGSLSVERLTLEGLRQCFSDAVFYGPLPHPDYLDALQDVALAVQTCREARARRKEPTQALSHGDYVKWVGDVHGRIRQTETELTEALAALAEAEKEIDT